jgi:hypothetical protein
MMRVSRTPESLILLQSYRRASTTFRAGGSNRAQLRDYRRSGQEHGKDGESRDYHVSPNGHRKVDQQGKQAP